MVKFTTNYVYCGSKEMHWRKSVLYIIQVNERLWFLAVVAQLSDGALTFYIIQNSLSVGPRMIKDSKYKQSENQYMLFWIGS